MLRGRILLVDDQHEVSRALGRILQRAEYDVSIARSGQDGLEMLDSGRWDIILTDLFMPEVTGIDVARAALQLTPTPSVLIMSGTLESDLVPEAIELLGREPLLKPISRADLLEVIEASLNDHRK